MSAGKTIGLIWLIWSACWALFWVVAGFFSLGFGWLGVPMSIVLAIPGAIPFLMRERRQVVIYPPQPPQLYRQVPAPPPQQPPYDPWA